MTQRSNRRTLAVLAIAAVLIITVIVVVAFRWHSGTEPTMPSAPVTTPATSAAPTYEPTDQYGSPEPALPRGAAVAGAGGTTTGPAGLPLGYSHDETGAVNAATNYLTWMSSLKITDKKLADSLATATAADAATQQALVESFDTLRPGLKKMAASTPQPARGAYAIADYSTDHAVVYVWYPVVTDTSGQAKNWWGIDAVALVWTDDDWKLDGALITKTGAAAVDPSDPTGDPSAEEKHSILSRTPADPGEITDTPDQSWFEYENAPH